ncbi:MAG TPA: DMT family transporter [Nocardioidaceae bacterium]|nr:DMT family transporter [Nocardioidaceae bacterium]
MPVVLLMAVGVVAVSMSAPLAAAMTVPALAVAFWRNALGTAVVAPTLRRSQLAEWRWMVLAGLALAVHFGTWIPSLRLTSVASATALVSLQFAWVVVWEVVRGRHYPRSALVGMAIAFAGTLVVSGVDLTISRDAILGDLLALVGGIGTAAYMLLGARVRTTTGTATYTVVAYGTCAAVLGVVCLASGTSLTGYDAEQWGLLLALTASAQLLGHSVFNHLLDRVAASTVGLVLLLEVPGAALLAAVFIGQSPPAATYVGLAVILAGMALVVRSTSDDTGVMIDV